MKTEDFDQWLDRSARALPKQAEPERDLWPEIESRLDEVDAPAERLVAVPRVAIHRRYRCHTDCRLCHWTVARPRCGAGSVGHDANRASHCA